MDFLPEPPLVAAGAIGGPFVMMLVTPLRNALTYGASNPQASLMQVYAKQLSSPFAGGHYMAIAACPGFLVLGPCYHIYNKLVRSVVGESSSTVSNAGACVLTGFSESMILYGSETRNAQISFNEGALKGGGGTASISTARLQSPFRPLGPGIAVHIFRNCVAMSGLRVFSAPCQAAMASVAPSLSPESRVVAGDMAANVAVSAISTPIHQAYTYAATMRLVEGAEGTGLVGYLKRQYLTEAGALSRVAARDVALRVFYNASIFTIFGAVERAFVSFWPKPASAEGDDGNRR